MAVTTPALAEHDPLIPHFFSLSFGQQVPGLIVSCDGLESKSEITEARAGGQGGRERPQSRTPGKLSFTPLQIKLFVLRGDTFFEDWFTLIHQDGKFKQSTRNGSIQMYDSENTVIAQWDITGAWPSKIAYSDLDADSNDAMSVTVTLAYENFERVQ
jgi:phage tail-like protein